jgi:hypothetical protein
VEILYERPTSSPGCKTVRLRGFGVSRISYDEGLDMWGRWP